MGGQRTFPVDMFTLRPGYMLNLHTAGGNSGNRAMPIRAECREIFLSAKAAIDGVNTFDILVNDADIGQDVTTVAAVAANAGVILEVSPPVLVLEGETIQLQTNGEAGGVVDRSGLTFIMRPADPKYPLDVIYTHIGMPNIGAAAGSSINEILPADCDLIGAVVWVNAQPTTNPAVLTLRVNHSNETATITVPISQLIDTGQFIGPSAIDHALQGDFIHLTSDGGPDNSPAAEITLIWRPTNASQWGELDFALFSEIDDYADGTAPGGEGHPAPVPYDATFVGFWVYPDVDPDATTVLSVMVDGVAQSDTYSLAAADTARTPKFFGATERFMVRQGANVFIKSDGGQIAASLLSYKMIFRR